MKTSILKADRKQALALAKTFESKKNVKGNPIFRVTIEKDLIEIHAPYKEDGEWKKNAEGKLERKLIQVGKKHRRAKNYLG